VVMLKVMLDQKVYAEIVGGVPPDAVHVVGVVLGVIELDECGRTLDSEMVGLVDRSATRPHKVQLLDAAGGYDTVRLKAGESRASALDEAGDQFVEVPALGRRDVTGADAAGMGTKVGQGLAVLVVDHRVAAADAVMVRILDLADSRHGSFTLSRRATCTCGPCTSQPKLRESAIT